MMNARDIVAAIEQGELSAAEVLEATLSNIKQHDPALNCFTALTADRARGEAAAIDKLAKSGAPLPPLAGVPYAVKNLFDIEGVVTLAGGKVNANNAPAAEDAELVARMKRAGAILVGALNMDEHAYGFTTENTFYGPTRNPHDTTRISGGSSGGSAAAVAGGLVPITLGSDTNGSIRVPSSLCGIFGLKPTYGRLPRTGSFPFVQDLDHLGPFARCVDDLVTSYEAMQGPDAQDACCAQRPRESVNLHESDAGSLRIGILGGWFEDWAGPQAREAVQRVAAAFEEKQKTEFKHAEAARSAAFIITGSQGGALHRSSLIERYDGYEPLSRDRLIAGSLIPSSWLVQAQRVRRAAYEEVMELFEHYDVLIAPATPVCAPTIGSESIEINGKHLPSRASMGLLTQPVSCIGLPVCTVPVWTDAALPIGVQLITAPWREDVCLAAAYRLEQMDVSRFRAPSSFMELHQ